MEYPRIINAAKILAFGVGAAFIVLYYASFNSNFGRFINSSFYGSYNVTSPFRNEQPVKDEHYELRKALEATSTEDKTVIVTTLNEAWAAPNSIFDLFLESFRIGNNISWLLNHLLVVAVDDKAYIRCQTLVSHCYFLKSNQSSTLSKEAVFMTPIYLDMMWERLAFLQTILELGYNFIFTDTDVMWFRNPLSHFTFDSDFQTSCDHFYGNEYDINNVPNNGFLFVRSNNRTIKFYKFWVNSRHTYPQLHEQDVFDRIKNSTYVRQLGVKFKFMNTNYFGGFCEPSKDITNVCTMHATCCVGLDTKINDLNDMLGDWKIYSSSNHTFSQYFRWSVPKQCHIEKPDNV